VGSLNGRLARLEGRMEPPEDPSAEARRKRVRAALDTLARLRREQGVAGDDVVPETAGEREALSILEALRERAER
jgi:hypothetical protein